MSNNTHNVVADWAEENGFSDVAQSLRFMSSAEGYVGMPICIYGPNFIWHGTLAAVHPLGVRLLNVKQIRDIPDLDDGTMDAMNHSAEQFFPWHAICNLGPVEWK